MAKVTSKLQLTVPKSIAERYGIRPGDELDWVPAGDVIRVVPPRALGRGGSNTRTKGERLRVFDQATERQRRREATLPRLPRRMGQEPAERGWKREDLYTRGRPR
jgi:AbrB family looped-hinge helix DNA binding protein